jgi:hypothetical protein
MVLVITNNSKTRSVQALSGSLRRRRRMSPWRGMTFVRGSLLTPTTRLRSAKQIMIFQ